MMNIGARGALLALALGLFSAAGAETLDDHTVQAVEGHAVQASATVAESPARIVLAWPADPAATGWTVERKLRTAGQWGPAVTLPAQATGWTDANVKVGTLYEYRITKLAPTYTAHWGGSAASLGYLCSGIRVALPDHRGTLLLIVDETMAAPLTAELARLKADLIGDGWTVIRHDVPRGANATGVSDIAAVTAVKKLIKADYDTAPGEVRSVLLFGHVPVPYSGNLNPDGHGEHLGAWSADMFYADPIGNWTDVTVNNPHPDWWPLVRNVPGDGKFDQNQPPVPVTLELGRVDLWNMPAFAKSETDLLRQYLNKDHNHRYSVTVLPRRGLIDDRFSDAGYLFGATGWRNWASFFGAGNVTGGKDNFTILADHAYLCFYGCGGGGPTQYGIDRPNPEKYPPVQTSDFARMDPKAAFFLLWGSWFGDWNVQDNLLRAPLATTSYGLASGWSGIPNWFIHTMAMGGTIGEALRLTQNNDKNGIYLPHTKWDNAVHIALMGDPTLRLLAIEPPASATVTRDAAGHSILRWAAAADATLGYHIFRAAAADGPFIRITSSPMTGTTYTDTTAVDASVYQVKAAKLETTAGGTFINLSQGVTAAPE